MCDFRGVSGRTLTVTMDKPKLSDELNDKLQDDPNAVYHRLSQSNYVTVPLTEPPEPMAGMKALMAAGYNIVGDMHLRRPLPPTFNTLSSHNNMTSASLINMTSASLINVTSPSPSNTNSPIKVNLTSASNINEHIKRPPNKFFVYSQQHRSQIAAEYPSMNHRDVSKILGENWRKLSGPEQAIYAEEADRLAELHTRDHPGYKYKPRPRKNRKGNVKVVNKAVPMSTLTSQLTPPATVPSSPYMDPLNPDNSSQTTGKSGCLTPTASPNSKDLFFALPGKLDTVPPTAYMDPLSLRNTSQITVPHPQQQQQQQTTTTTMSLHLSQLTPIDSPQSAGPASSVSSQGSPAATTVETYNLTSSATSYTVEDVSIFDFDLSIFDDVPNDPQCRKDDQAVIPNEIAPRDITKCHKDDQVAIPNWDNGFDINSMIDTYLVSLGNVDLF